MFRSTLAGRLAYRCVSESVQRFSNAGTFTFISCSCLWLGVWEPWWCVVFVELILLPVQVYLNSLCWCASVSWLSNPTQHSRVLAVLEWKDTRNSFVFFLTASHHRTVIGGNQWSIANLIFRDHTTPWFLHTLVFVRPYSQVYSKIIKKSSNKRLNLGDIWHWWQVLLKSPRMPLVRELMCKIIYESTESQASGLSITPYGSLHFGLAHLIRHCTLLVW